MQQRQGAFKKWFGAVGSERWNYSEWSFRISLSCVLGLGQVEPKSPGATSRAGKSSQAAKGRPTTLFLVDFSPSKGGDRKIKPAKSPLQKGAKIQANR